MNLESKTERLTSTVVSICETVCSQYEICIQMLDGKEYQTLYKVMKKEQRIQRMGEIIEHKIRELKPYLQGTSIDQRRLSASSNITKELIQIKDHARIVASFANRCKDPGARSCAQRTEQQFVKTLRMAMQLYQMKQLEDDSCLWTMMEDTKKSLLAFKEDVVASEWKQGLIESMHVTFDCVQHICDQVHHLYTGDQTYELV